MLQLLERLDLEDAVSPQRALPSLILLNGRLDALAAGEAAALLGIRSSGVESAGLATMARGMDTLPQGLATALGGHAGLHLRSQARRLTRGTARWIVDLDHGPLEADAVILAVPPVAAAALLESLAPDAATVIGGLPARSSLTVSLAYPRDAVAHPLDATGFVVPPGTPAPGGLAACTFASAKFADRSPPRGALLRVFFRPDPADLDEGTDDEWGARAHAVLASILGLGMRPIRTWVSRWPRALPDHGPEYAAAVSRCEDLLHVLPGLVLAGSAFHGPGVEGAVRSGAIVAERLRS